MRILSANINGRGEGTPTRQLEALLEQHPDVIALQEMTAGVYTHWCRGLTKNGYSVVSTVDLVALPYPPPPYPSPPFPPRPRERQSHIQRKNFNILGARHPIAPLVGLSFANPEEGRFAFPEKYVAARVLVEGLEFDVHNAHLPPGSSRGVLKVHAFEAIRRRVDQSREVPRILCGDFNAPWAEDAKGPRLERRRKWPEEIKRRWLKSERAIVANPDMRDVYRDVHEEGQPFPASHFTGRGDRTTPHRYDFVFASGDFETIGCRYLTEWLEDDHQGRQLSDHAPVVADLQLERATSCL